MSTPNENTPKELNVYEKRFLLMMKLIKIDKMLQSATVTHTKLPKE